MVKQDISPIGYNSQQ